MRYHLISLVMIAACTQNGGAKDYYDSAEAGSTWQLSLDNGKRVDSVYGPDYYKGACPAFAARTAHLPAADGSVACDPGCTCSFDFSLEDSGDVGHNYSVDAGFQEQCDDGSSITCVDPDPMIGEVGFCTWISGKIDPKVDPFGDCTYTFTLSEL